MPRSGDIAVKRINMGPTVKQSKSLLGRLILNNYYKRDENN